MLLFHDEGQRMKGWGMTITEDAVYSIDEVRERFGAEDLDVNTDIATTVLLTETEGGLLLKLADYPIALMWKNRPASMMPPSTLVWSAASWRVSAAR